MSQLQSNRNKFEVAKIAIKQFSENLPHTPSLDKFGEETFFGLMPKNVTGGDMNKFVEQVQKMFYESNASVIKLFKEFKEVYNVLEILDEEYIEKFEKTLNHLEKVSIEANEVAKDNRRIIVALKVTIDNLNVFKNLSSNQIVHIEYRLNSFETILDTKLNQLNKIEEIKVSIEKYQHFMDVDELWSDVQIHKEQISNLVDASETLFQELTSINNHITRIEALKHIDDVDVTWEQLQNHSTEIKLIIGNLRSLNALKSKIEGITHLLNIDEMWNNLEKIKLDIPNIYSKLDKQNNHIQILNTHKDYINSIIHLKDVDQLWNDNIALKKEVIEVKRLHQEYENKSNESIIELIDKNRVLEELIHKNQIKSNSKISYAYIVGGLALLLIIIQFGLDFSK